MLQALVPSIKPFFGQLVSLSVGGSDHNVTAQTHQRLAVTTVLRKGVAPNLAVTIGDGFHRCARAIAHDVDLVLCRPRHGLGVGHAVPNGWRWFLNAFEFNGYILEVKMLTFKVDHFVF